MTVEALIYGALVGIASVAGLIWAGVAFVVYVARHTNMRFESTKPPQA